MAYRIILRRDTSANWTTNDPVLLSGEPGYETDTGYFKIGDGLSTWTNLDFYMGATGPQGESGATGPQGESGATGPQGESGATGPQGESGATGPAGAGTTGPNTFYGNQNIGPSGGTAGTLVLDGYASLGFTGDSGAESAGIPLGGLYHDTEGNLKIRLT
jgi:hypothetical protein